jgi:hypothetical protein
VQIVRQPVGTTVTEKQPQVTLSAAAAGRNPITAQWFRNGTAVPNATNFTFTFNASVADDNASYFLRATNNVNGTNFAAASSNVVLRVIADTAPPTLVRVQNVGSNAVEVTFQRANGRGERHEPGELFDSRSCHQHRNAQCRWTHRYTDYQPDYVWIEYTVRISNVTDTATSPNPISPNPTVASFTGQAYAINDIGASGVGLITT